MEDNNDRKDFVETIGNQYLALCNQAYAVYKPMVDDICSRVASQNEVEHVFDYLLGFACEGKFLVLYKQVCRSYWEIYLDSVAFYINAYREDYEEGYNDTEENEIE